MTTHGDPPPRPTGKARSVTAYLHKQAIDYQLVSATQVPAEQIAVVSLLTDEQHSFAAFLPGNRILDLRLLDSQLDANLGWDEQGTLKAKTGLALDKLPAIPALLGRQCVVDSELLNLTELYIESGQQDLLLRLQQADFATLLQSARTLLFSQAIPATNPNLLPSSLEHDSGQDGVYSLTAVRIKQILHDTTEIPPLPNTAQKVLKLRNNPHASIDELTSIIETDPAMAAQVMSWASSPYYAAPGKVRSIEEAIVRVLGFDLVINLALALALGKSLQLPQNAAHSSRDYWRSAIYTATLIEGMARLMPRKQQPEIGLAYLAGLLHSFGYILLAHLFPSYFNLTNQYLAANQHLRTCQVEFFLLGITREQMGAWLMQHWQMPNELTTAIREQHNPDYQGEHATYARLACLANQLLASQDQRQHHIAPQIYQQLGISHEQARQALDNVLAAEKALRKLAALFSS